VILTFCHRFLLHRGRNFPAADSNASGFFKRKTDVDVFYLLLAVFRLLLFSPLHLCQLLTIQYTGCDLREVMRENLKILPPLVTGSIILYFFYRWLLSESSQTISFPPIGRGRLPFCCLF
jgi:hypothetical protein